jgi:hypothetical protein
VAQSSPSRLDRLYLTELGRARRRVETVRKRFPSADNEELVQHLIDSKKGWAGTGGAISGLFGWLGLPADLALVVALQLSLIIEVAIVHRVNLKSARAKEEVFEVLGYSSGTDARSLAARSAPWVAARIARALFTREAFGRIVPLLAAPLSAHLNARDLQKAGDEALRFYGTIRRLPSRTRSEPLGQAT